MGRFGDRWDHLRQFLSRDVWEIDPADFGRARFFLIHQVQILSLVGRDFIADRCLLRASALTYTTLLSIVPLLALMFSVLKGLGVQNALEPLILERLAVGSGDAVNTIVNYINNTNVGQLGTAGLVTLVVTVLALLSNIEESFNHIWGVKETRTLTRRFSDYFSVVILGPILLLVAVSMTATLQTQGFVRQLMGMAYVGEVILLLFKVLPYVAMWAAFTFLYVFMPNTKVRLAAALVGGIAGGTLWQLCQWGYVHFQVGVARYNAIYGTMAALPIFMIWLYISWLIVLFGLEVTYAWQNLRTVRQEFRGGDVDFDSRQRVALTILVVLADAFMRGERHWTREKLGAALDLPPRLVRTVLDDLTRLGFVSLVKVGEQDAFQPARALETLPVARVFEGLRRDGVSYHQMGVGAVRDVVEALEKDLEAAVESTLENLTVRDLVDRVMAAGKSSQ